MGRSKSRKDRKVNKIRIGILIVLILALGFLVTTIFRPVKLYHGAVTAEYKEKFVPEKQIKKVYFGTKKDVKIEGQVNTDKKGKYKIYYCLNSHKIPLKVIVKDTKPPVLKLKNLKTDTVEKIKPDLFVKKVHDKDKVKLEFGKNDDRKKPGKYRVEIIAVDASGNKTSEFANLTREKDKTAPKISGIDDITISIDPEFDLKEGMSIVDNLDRNPKVVIEKGDFDSTVPGTYEVIYKVTDRSGNETKFVRKITVTDNKPDANILAGKNVYLTFDDGPSANTGKILDILKKEGIKATFFVTGCNQAYNYNIARAAKEGHTIALHTYTHQYSIYSSEETYFNDLNQISNMVENLTGIKSHFIRFPGGSSNTVSANYNRGIMGRLSREVTKKGYKYFDWNCSSGDASGNTVPKDVIVRGATSCGQDNVMILFHDSEPKTTTVAALPEIINYYKKNGYKFRKIEDGCFEPHHGINN